MTMTISSDEPVAIALTRAVRSGDLDALSELLSANPGLAAARLVNARGSKTPLHVVTDWPGYFANGPAVARALLAAGADPNAAAEGGQFAETALHWAASSDDVDVAEVLIDAGADIEAPGGSIAGTPLANAVGYGCWSVGRLLVARGARVDSLWQAAGLGLLERVEELCADGPSAGEINDAFWQACHGAQRRVAEYLLARGADINARPGWSEQSPLEIAQSFDTRRETLITWLRERGA
jgi:ankyrin repeat protein